MNLGFQKKTIVLGGGGGGIGQATKKLLLAEGADVLVADRASGTDFSDQHNVATYFNQLKKTHDKIDGYVSLVHGGDHPVANLMEVSLDEIEYSMDNTFYAALYPILESVRWMAKTGGGSIVVVSSINTQLGLGGQIGYDMAKGGLNRLGPDFLPCFEEHGVYVVTLCPGTVCKTKPWEGQDDVLEEVRQTIPDKIVTEPREVAHAIAFYLSEWGRMFNGSTVVADRGWSITKHFTRR
jgi:NAD(P)-dependent dehydrogenase (short-subunit alcohol dehydrogenase family)